MMVCSNIPTPTLSPTARGQSSDLAQTKGTFGNGVVAAAPSRINGSSITPHHTGGIIFSRIGSANDEIPSGTSGPENGYRNDFLPGFPGVCASAGAELSESPAGTRRQSQICARETDRYRRHREQRRRRSGQPEGLKPFGQHRALALSCLQIVADQRQCLWRIPFGMADQPAALGTVRADHDGRRQRRHTGSARKGQPFIDV